MFLATKGADFYKFSKVGTVLLLWTYTSLTDVFVANLVEWIEIFLLSVAYKDRHFVKYTFLRSGDPKTDISTNISTLIFYGHHTSSIP